MKKTGAFLTVYALEQIGVKYTFGIPGVHNTEIYDALNSSEKITPILVTHESCASFMADAVSRTSDSLGTCVIVPAAGLTHAMSGIGEAFLDGIPTLIISGGTRRDTGKFFQLHQIDQRKILEGIIKKYFLVEKHEDIIPTIYKSYTIAREGTPGPVFIEIPAEIQMFSGDIESLPEFISDEKIQFPDQESIRKAAEILLKSRYPGIYTGWGAVDAMEIVKKIADFLTAPVSTTFQGLSSFPANHPFHTGVGFGPSGIPAAQEAFKNCDALLAVGARFSELATGSYGMKVPANLIHVDINPDVFNRNYPCAVSIEGDSIQVLEMLYQSLVDGKPQTARTRQELADLIKKEKEINYKEWIRNNDEKVSPGNFFTELRKALPDNAIIVCDDGAHTFLTAELFPVNRPRGFISPTDFNCMGYCVPAAIAARVSNPDLPVIGIAGDGSFMMTALELVTAATLELGIIIFIFNDGELGQISQFQKIPLNRKTCTKLGKIDFEGIAIATGAQYLQMKNDAEINSVIKQAFSFAESNTPVIVDVNIDYSKKTYMTKGVVKTNLSRFTLSEKLRFISRSIKRHIAG
ncbi:MAG TPA: thiamine pyrophosphate-binding protein [Cyclobacteriaceae bacterium]|nr:thiamine pyrophosphate-binding protein [Cyclobacteriaceae bacterium]